ncbi:MAG TPA: DUF2079 domain-containing protein [Candidatus Udaeobacter sp.]|nr:DUF2079 domain-containing protein [Candidatus Udaeobacter sp.]
MPRRWREMFTSNVLAPAPPWDRWDVIALSLAVVITLFVFALKLNTFYKLGYSGDLFVSVQAARGWLEARGVLQDNCFGNVLAIHTYFLLLPLGLLAKPFGAPGLLFVLAASATAAYFWATRILRVLGVDARIALILSGAFLISPLSVRFYQEAGHGFHVEAVVPALCLILFYFLLRQRTIASVVTALVIFSVKEDAPIAAGLTAIIAGVETWTSATPKSERHRFNLPAAIVLILSVCAVPVLLLISWLQPPTTYAHHSLDRLGVVAPGTLSNPAALFGFVESNIAHWLGSSVVRQWLWIMVIGTFGTIVLRPYYLIIGVITTLVAWLVNRNDLMWAPRFFSTETLIWCVTLVGAASIARTVSNCGTQTRRAVLGSAIAVAVVAAALQLAVAPWFVRTAYLFRSLSLYSSSERRQANALFARYRAAAKPEEPVIASSLLFRYAHDRNLFWLDRLHGRPAPIWILGDGEDPYVPFRIGADKINPASGVRLTEYQLVGHRGRFVLLKKKE